MGNVQYINAQHFISIGKEMLSLRNENPEGCPYDSINHIIREHLKNRRLNKEEKARIKRFSESTTGCEILFYIAAIVSLGDKVYQRLKGGFKEEVYQDALEKELIWNHIPYIREKHLSIYYADDNGNDVELQHTFRADFFVNNQIVVETKARFIDMQSSKESENNPSWVQTQIENYMAATKQNYGVLLNFYGANIFSTLYIR